MGETKNILLLGAGRSVVVDSIPQSGTLAKNNWFLTVGDSALVSEKRKRKE